MIKAEEEEAVKAKALIEKGNIQEAATLVAEAIDWDSRSTSLNPTKPEMWFWRGNLYWEIKDISQGAEEWALKCYKKAYELDPGNQIYRQKAEMLEKTAE